MGIMPGEAGVAGVAGVAATGGGAGDAGEAAVGGAAAGFAPTGGIGSTMTVSPGGDAFVGDPGVSGDAFKDGKRSLGFLNSLPNSLIRPGLSVLSGAASAGDCDGAGAAGVVCAPRSLDRPMTIIRASKAAAESR